MTATDRLTEAFCLTCEATGLLMRLSNPRLGSRAELVRAHAIKRVARRQKALDLAEEASRALFEESALDRALERQDRAHAEDKDDR